MKYVFILVLLLGSLIAQAKVKVDVRYSPVANFIYQLDCVSESLSNCSKQNYQALWDKHFLKKKAEKDAVKKWGELISRYQSEVETGGDNYKSTLGNFNGIKLSSKLRIASLQANDSEAYFENLSLLMTPRDRASAQEIFNQFYPSFLKWWNKEAKPQGEAFSEETGKILSSQKISEKLKQFVEFYEVDLPGKSPVSFNLLYRPNFVDEATRGQQIENYSVTEFLPGESATDRMDVIIHELCHFFWESTDPHKFRKFEESLSNKEGLEVMPAFNLINESLATVFGNGMINRLYMEEQRWKAYLARPKSFYNADDVDKAAKALLPLLDEWIKKGRSLYHKDFAERYLSTLKKAFGKELTAPQRLLGKMILLVDGRLKADFQTQIRRNSQVKSMWISSGNWEDERFLANYHKHKYLNALLVVHPSHLLKLKEHKLVSETSYKELMESYNEDKRLIYAHPRNEFSMIYIIAAESEEQSKKLIDQLFGLNHSFIGVLPR